MTKPTLTPLHRVATRLGLPERTLVLWSQAGRFPRVYRKGGLWVVFADDLESWMASRPGNQKAEVGA